MNILLTGFMCAGKTTIGRKLAKLLDYNFIDTDMEIEEDQGCSVEEIFKYGGEECFRDMETKVLGKLKNVKNSVIATGGGIILREFNQGILKQIGRQVYLKVPKKELLQRLNNVKNRPLLTKLRGPIVRQYYRVGQHTIPQKCQKSANGMHFLCNVLSLTF